jgi:predicted nuclease of predicted toxin-antitoxin system
VTVLVDECVPFKLVRLLTGHAFVTAQEKGWGSFKNGKLLALAEREFDLFLTCDRNLQYQQNLRGRKISILLLSTNQWPTLKGQASLVQAAFEKVKPGEFLTVEIPLDMEK